MTDTSYAPPPYRPMSALAVIALVLSIVFLLGGIGGFWWIQLLPVVLCVFAWGAMSSGRKRGTGLAIAASIVAVLGGLASFGCAMTLRSGASDMFQPLTKALAADDREVLKKWAAADEKEEPFDVRADRWKTRMAAGKAAVGAQTSTFEVGGSLLNPLFGAFVPPDGPTEVEPKGAAPVEPWKALWMRAECEKGTLWVAIQSSQKGIEAFSDSMKGAKDKDDVEKADKRLVTDVRVFVEPK